MKIGEFFVKRPVTTSMMYLGLMLFGGISWFMLPQELFPNISVPQLVVITKYPNAAPEEIENLLTKPIEEAVGTVPNLRRVRAICKEGMSVVKLEFAWGTDMGFAHLATREKLDRVKDKIPQEAEEPIIKRVNPFAQPVLIISVTGNLELATMTKLCEDVVKKKLEKTEGVASVQISGGQKKEVLIDVDRGRLEASRVSLPMVVEAIKNANYDYPAGTTQGKVVEYLVRTHGRFQTLDDIRKTIVQVENPEMDPTYKWKKTDDRDNQRYTREQRLIPLSDIAEVSESLQDKTSYSRYNGRENISISIQKQSDANTVKMAKAVRAAMEDMKVSLPKGFGMEIIYDESEYIVESLNNMRDNIVEGGILAFCILLFFLGDLRDALFAGLSIPIAIMMTLIIMSVTGFTVNMLTLAGIALAVGAMSDCAICMVENITRFHRVLKVPLKEAAIDGTDEMAIPMICSIGTNIVVFIPLLFVSGIAQQLFYGLFMVTIFTHLAALFVSLTFIPRMAAYEWDVPGFKERPKWLEKIMFSDAAQAKMNQKYRTILNYVIDHPWFVIQVIICMAVISVFLFIWTPKVFMPKMDQGQFMVQLTMPIGTRLEVTNGVAKKLESIFTNFQSADVSVNIGSAQEDEEIEALQAHQARLAVKIDVNKTSTFDVIEKFKAMVKRENLEGGLVTYLLQDSPLRAALSGGAPVEVELKGPELDRLKSLSDAIVKEFSEQPFLYGVQTTFALPSKETKVVVDKDRAAGYQFSVADIAKTALIAIKGMEATEFKKGADDIKIRVRLRKVDREDAESIRQLAIRSPMKGVMVPLGDVAKVLPGVGASEIRHLDQQRACTVTAEISGVGSSKALSEVAKILKKYQTSKDYSIDLGGESKRMSESFSGLKYTFLLALLLTYMIMAAQFESLIQPLIIMATVPLSVIGVVITLFVSNTPLSSVAVLGVVILAGIVVNNGIVMIDHINTLAVAGHTLRHSIIEGCVTRLRPIVMTCLVTILGVLPLTLGVGKGDELAQPLAVVTFGGLFVSTLLTLFIIPSLYYQVGKRMAARVPKAPAGAGAKA